METWQATSSSWPPQLFEMALMDAEAGSLGAGAVASQVAAHRARGEYREMGAMKMSGKRKEAASWWLEQKPQVAAAIKEAEASTGHQIVVVVARLGKYHAQRASHIARKNSGASLVFCVDALQRRYELRWQSDVTLSQSVLDSTTELFRQQNLAEAIRLVAQSLPVHTPGENLPDIIDE